MAASPRTRVYLTVDVECAEERIVGGALQPAMGYDLRVFGRLRNQRAALGLEHILDVWERHGHRATFYVESLGARSFGAEGLAEACALIRGRGHDVQMHAHPCQEDAYWRSGGRPRIADDLRAYDRAGQEALLRRCRDALVACGVPTASLVSFRAGNFAADRDTWAAMAALGLAISSNYDLGWRHRDALAQPRPQAGLFAAGGGVWELPITVFRQRLAGPRHLQIRACSAAELLAALAAYHRAGVGDVTIVSHSFEFLHIDSIEGRRGRPNTVTQARLATLAEFLAAARDRFEVLTVAELGRRLADGTVRPGAPVELARGSTRLRALRVLGQLYQRAQARLPLP